MITLQDLNSLQTLKAQCKSLPVLHNACIAKVAWPAWRTGSGF